MENELETFSLPTGPKGLCFDRNHFLGDNFSVDVFLHNHRNAASLETLRDDLGVYLRVLRSAMIELINKDYADFVNLSAKLIGLDKRIDSIRSPLGQLREEVLHIRECLSEATKELHGRLEQKRVLRERKRSVQYLGQTRTSLDKLSKILLDRDSAHVLTREAIERACSEYVRLKFTITKCENLVSAEQNGRFERVGQILSSTLENMFLENLNTNEIDKVQRCLRTYSTLDSISEAEIILRKRVVSPAMHEIINEVALQKNSSGLKGIFSNILSFYEHKLRDSTLMTKFNKRSSIKGYDFVLNSFWPEVEYRLEIDLSSIFGAGNPELFYSRYNDSLEFLKSVQTFFHSDESLKSFFNHPQYKSFQQKWNLPIYYQIRFQEIASCLESALQEPINDKSFTTDSGDFMLKTTSFCWTSLTKCWADGIFIVALTHRFWKLSLQIISRYCTWIDANIKQSWNGANQADAQKLNSERLKFCVSLYCDIKRLIEMLPTFLEIIKTRLRLTRHIDIFEKCLVDSKMCLESKIPQIQKAVVLQVSSESVTHLKQLNDIPRLFRKTNRDVPTKPCTYVSNLTKSPMDFYGSYKSNISDVYIIEWLEAIFSIITVQYYTAVDDVLTSIQKTEDSLRRLKQIRDRPQQNSQTLEKISSQQNLQNLEKTGYSDDDKIRLQLKVDVDFYCLTLIDIKVDVNRVEKLNDLIILVEKATNSRSNLTIQ